MADSPIPKQEGLSKEQLDSMTIPPQKFSEYSPAETLLKPQLGTQSQKESIEKNIHKIMVNHEKRLQKLDSKDEYANYKELVQLADELTDFVCDLVKTPSVTVTTQVSTTSTIGGTQTTTSTPPVTTPIVLIGSGTGTGTATNTQVMIQ